LSSVFTSTYHDTPDGRFIRTGISLRRRVENGLSIWEVELPEAPGEVALSEPGGPAEPPPLVADLLRGLLRGRELVEVATMQTRRSGGDVGEAVHDEVAIMEDRHVIDSFEVDGAPEDPGLRVMQKRRRSSRPNIGDLRKITALPYLQAMIREQYDEILAHDPGTRLGTDPESLHKFRVAVRRLRAVLRAARPILDRPWTDQLRDDLAWLGKALGTVRDHDVLVEHVRAQAPAMSPDEQTPLERLTEAIETQREGARGELLEVLSSQRYLELLGRIELAGELPRWNGVRRSVKNLAAREFRKFERELDRLGQEPSNAELHRLRVRGKRARYAGELAAPAVGKPAHRFVKRAKEVQDVLGEHQDAVVAEDRLRELIRAKRDPGISFVAGRLIERQRLRMSAARRRSPKALRKLRKAGRKAWA
jgi:CHAD domain-containing protein